MKNFRNLIFALMIMVGVSMADSTGIWFSVSMGLCLVPAIVLGIEEWNKKKEYEKAKANSENIDYLGAGHFVTEYEVKTEITNQ